MSQECEPRFRNQRSLHLAANRDLVYPPNEMVGDGIAPGSVQVPGSGQPIVLLADRQTTGGYPKIATVISADLPAMGRLIAGDEQSYRYLAESIRMHPDQENLKTMMQQAGFEECDYFNLSGGIVALHRGFRF